jgi:probable addiction module antidote protein
MRNPSEPLDDYLLQKLKEDGFRREYLKEALSDDDYRVFLKALHLAIKASDKTMTEVAAIAGVKREHLHRALSQEGNPSWATVSQLLHGLGYDLSLKKRSAYKTAQV